MRLWTLHPKYLDPKGLVALWRETLLAKHVLEGRTRGYVNHPQLWRFKQLPQPVDAINEYLSEIHHEALKREYNFDRSKINWDFRKTRIKVTRGQLAYEWKHLLKKLESRDTELFHGIKNKRKIEIVTMFDLVDGDVEHWEITEVPRRKR